jgi:hypothetical protein
VKGEDGEQALSSGENRTEQLTYSPQGVGALILGVAFVVYPGTLQPALVTVVGHISTALSGITIAP